MTCKVSNVLMAFDGDRAQITAHSDWSLGGVNALSVEVKTARGPASPCVKFAPLTQSPVSKSNQMDVTSASGRSATGLYLQKRRCGMGDHSR